MSTYPELTPRQVKILRVLACEPGFRLEDEEGFCTSILKKKLGWSTKDTRSLSMMLLDLQRLDLIDREILGKGRKTYEITLLVDNLRDEDLARLGLTTPTVGATS